MNKIFLYQPWHHVRKAILNSAPLPISILHKKKEVKQPQHPPPPPPKKCEKKPERKNESKNQNKKKPIGVIYF